MRAKISIALLAALIIGSGRQATKERAFISKGETSMMLDSLVAPDPDSLLGHRYQLTDVMPEDYGISQIQSGWHNGSWSRPGSSMASNAKRITLAGGDALTVTARDIRR